jgi:hypothetical protein
MCQHNGEQKICCESKEQLDETNHLGCAVGNTAVPQCCSNMAQDTNFLHVTKMINKTKIQINML